MTSVSQGDLRSWARSQGLPVNSRGGLPVSISEAYAAAHPTQSREGRSNATTRTSTGRTAARRTRALREPVVDPIVAAPGQVAETTDFAGGLRSYLDSIDSEVREVSALSVRIDGLVAELNDLREQQARRLIALDELRASVTDKTLGSFLDQSIKPRKTRVSELIPERLL